MWLLVICHKQASFSKIKYEKIFLLTLSCKSFSMAELNISNNRSRKKYFHKHIRVDLTPMVDLGFLLITFFILTTTLQEQGVTKLVLPKDSIINTLLPASTTLTFILERSDSIGYYDGLSTEIRYENFASMRSIIRQK